MILNDDWKPKLTLKELVDRQKFTGETDSALIAEWFENNNMAVEGIKIISKLAEQKITNDEWKYGLLCGDLSMYGCTENVMKDFGIKVGCELNHIITTWIICYRLEQNYEEVYPTSVEWLKNNIPNYNKPAIFWQPFIAWLHEHDIYFKDEKKEGN